MTFFLVIRMILHFLVLIDILFILHQSDILSMSLEKEDRSSWVLITLYILLSSAYHIMQLSCPYELPLVNHWCILWRIMVPTKNPVGHQRLRLTNRKPADVLLNNSYTNWAYLIRPRGHHICKVGLKEYHDRRGQRLENFIAQTRTYT